MEVPIDTSWDGPLRPLHAPEHSKGHASPFCDFSAARGMGRHCRLRFLCLFCPGRVHAAEKSTSAFAARALSSMLITADMRLIVLRYGSGREHGKDALLLISR